VTADAAASASARENEEFRVELTWSEGDHFAAFATALLAHFAGHADSIIVERAGARRVLDPATLLPATMTGATALLLDLPGFHVEVRVGEPTNLRVELAERFAPRWFEVYPGLQSPTPVLAFPRGSELPLAFVGLAHSVAPLRRAVVQTGATSQTWEAGSAGRPLVAEHGGATWRVGRPGEPGVGLFTPPAAPQGDDSSLLADLRRLCDPPDVAALVGRLASASGVAVALGPLGNLPSAFHVSAPLDAVLALLPESDRVVIRADLTLPADLLSRALAHATGHLRLGHVRPGDPVGHWDTLATIDASQQSRRWDREVRDAFPHWRPAGVPKRASLAECTPIEKSWLVLLQHIGQMVGETRTLHERAAAYQPAAYQRQAAQRLVAQLDEYGGAMLCDGVGLGKTYVATTVMVHYANARRDELARLGRSLADDPFRISILAPRSVVSTWQREALPPLAAQHVPLREVRVISHTVLSRIEASSKALEREGGELADLEHLLLSDLVIVDEAHNFRSVSARRTVVLRDLLRLQPRKDVRRKVLLLTATPVNNSLDDLRQEISLLFCRPLWLNTNATVDGYRQRAPRDVEERVAKARRSAGEVSPVLIHGSADAKFSFALDFRNDLKLGVKVEDIPEYLKEQEKRLELVQAATKAAMKAHLPPPAEPVRVAADLLDRIVVQRSRALCKQIEREQGSDVRLLFRPDAPPPQRLVYDDEYDGESDVLARFLPLFATGEEAAAATKAPLSLKVYMWADVRDGVADAEDSSPVVGLQRILVLKRLESSPVAFLITVLRLLALHAFRLKQLSDHAHDLGERIRAEQIDAEIAHLLRPQEGWTHDDLARVDLLLTGGDAAQEGRELLKRWGQAHLGVKPEAVGEDLPATQLGMFARAIESEEAASRKEQLDRLWTLKDDLVRDFGTLLGVAPGLADIVFGKFAREDWPRRFCAKGAVLWPDSATWGRRIVTDAKIRRLVGQLLRGRADGQKIVVFSQFTDTLAYIQSVFAATGRLDRADWSMVLRDLKSEAARAVSPQDIDGLLRATRTVTGETEDRDAVIDAFAPFYRIGPKPPAPAGADASEQASLVDLWRVSWMAAMRDPVDVLLASDVLAEGVNLQDAALLVNYDVHWNPVRMIQRAGRIDRRLNPAIEDATSFPELAALAEELDFTPPTYWWHGRPDATPTTVNLLLSDELEAQLALRERIANKTLAIDFTLGLEQGTGAEAEWMTGYRYQGISALNAWQRDRAIEQVAGYQERIRRMLGERTIDAAWVEQWNGWLRQEGAGDDGPILGFASASVAASARTGSRYLTPRIVEGIPHWLWSPSKPADSPLNEWIVLDGKTSPATTRTDLPWSEDASRPVTPDDVLSFARSLLDHAPSIEERGREIGKPVYQGIPAILAGFFSSPADRRSLRIGAFRLLQLKPTAINTPLPDPQSC
jgi:hypothetical protein